MACDVEVGTKQQINVIENSNAHCDNAQNINRNPYGFERKVAVVNGKKMSYFSVGNGKNTFVFLHGWGSDATAFFFAMKQLCAKYRVVALDFFGFGQSDFPPDYYDVAHYANDVAKLLERLKIENATFLGHSFGGRVAIELAVFYPQIVNRIVLIDSAGIKPRRKPSYYLKVLAHKILKKLGKSGLKGSSDYSLLSDDMKKVFVKVVNYDQKNLLEKIKCPCAVFWGKSDKETPLYMYKCFLKKIDGAQGFLLDGGHFAFVEDRYAFLLILAAYLAETDEGIS